LLLPFHWLPLLYFTCLVFWKAEEPVRTGGYSIALIRKRQDVSLVSFVTSLFFFVLNTGVGGVGGWAARVHARTQTRNIPSPSFARGSLRGAQARWEGGKGDDDSKMDYKFIPISALHTLGSTSLSSVFPMSQMEKAARSDLRRIIILMILRVFFDLRCPSQWRTWTG